MPLLDSPCHGRKSLGASSLLAGSVNKFTPPVNSNKGRGLRAEANRDAAHDARATRSPSASQVTGSNDVAGQGPKCVSRFRQVSPPVTAAMR